MLQQTTQQHQSAQVTAAVQQGTSARQIAVVQQATPAGQMAAAGLPTVLCLLQQQQLQAKNSLFQEHWT
jgi:hypothetical protein